MVAMVMTQALTHNEAKGDMALTMDGTRTTGMYGTWATLRYFAFILRYGRSSPCLVESLLKISFL